ncbi:hypothetical protein KVR01_007698 [Diaporthe batatas]|uniref:uncharacterized protein n=1 Tax=Diaporthe batatas TaxID=748121 RepID=UPI001D056495|nr:uncharacterized protein KVR01_007698 [Diaporthe batatas]KAG8161933.1 hypothetical protein KVR01_007698 [Diaporthe batatas]
MASTKNMPRMVELAAQISTAVSEMQERLTAQGAPSPSWAEDSPESLPLDLFDLRDAVIDASAELQELLMEPMMLIFKFASISNLASIDAISRYHIPDMIPPGGQISFEDIAAKTGLPKREVKRLVTNAISMRIMTSPEPEMVAHTRISKFLTIPYVNAWVNFESKDTWPATTRIVDAMEKWPSSEDVSETGFALANGKSVFEVLATDPPRAMRFAGAMQALEHVPGYALSDVVKAYDWNSLGHASIVQVGGQRGQTAIKLAENFENVKFLVQDSEMIIQGAESDVPPKLKGRVEFQEHGLFEPQTVKADVYFLRMVLRSWSDQNAVNALKAQVPVLRPGVKILIQEAVMPEPGTIPLWNERVWRSVDMSLKNFFNGHERYLDEWKTLLAAADERFVLHRAHMPGHTVLGMLEVHWDVSRAVGA